MKQFEIVTPIYQYSSIDELPKEFADLCMKADMAARKAYAPYSKFRVGACVLLQNGETILGNNQENAAYPSGLCAERVALFYANANFPNEPVKAIAIMAYQNGDQVALPISPCGSCRQVIAETQMRYNQKITLLLFAKDRIYLIPDANSLLPLSFSKNDLGE